jgi:hypothetical protein
MFGLFGKFGRARELRQLDEALRAVDLHPAMVPDAVELTAIRLLKEARGGSPEPEDYAAAAELLAYCMIGAEGFAGANSEGRALAIEARIERALDAGDSLDSRLILLTLHAGIIQPSVVALFELEQD